MNDAKNENNSNGEVSWMKEDIEAVREELEQYQITKKYIQYIKEKIASLRSRINSATFQVREIDIQYTADPLAKEELLAALVDLQILYGQKQVETERLCYDLEVKIGKVDGVPGLILSKKYIQGKSFEKIAEELSYSYRQIKGLHLQGLSQFMKRWIKKIANDEIIGQSAYQNIDI